MMIPYHRKAPPERLERRAHPFSNDRMLPHDSHFFRVQRSRFEKDAVWHSDFSYVMKPAGNSQFLKILLLKTDAFPQQLGVRQETLRVAIPHGLFRINGPRQRKHHGLRLLVHVVFEAQESLDAAQGIPKLRGGSPNI